MSEPDPPAAGAAEWPSVPPPGPPPAGPPPAGPPPAGPPPAGPPLGVPPPGAPGGPPPGAPRPPTWARPPRPGQRASFAPVSADAGAWAAAGVLGGVVLTAVADVLLAADRLSVSGFRAYANGTLRARFLVLSGFASLDIAVALLVAVGLAVAIKPSAPAAFRRTVIAGTGALAALIIPIAVLRALVTITYGHAFGVAGFVQDLAAIPVAIATLGIAMVASRPSTT